MCNYKSTSYDDCEHKPKEKKKYLATGGVFFDGEWQGCGWTIEANSFTEAAQIAESDETFKLHSITEV